MIGGMVLVVVKPRYLRLNIFYWIKAMEVLKDNLIYKKPYIF